MDVQQFSEVKFGRSMVIIWLSIKLQNLIVQIFEERSFEAVFLENFQKILKLQILILKCLQTVKLLMTKGRLQKLFQLPRMFTDVCKFKGDTVQYGRK